MNDTHQGAATAVSTGIPGLDTILGGTSVEGLQQTFLQREGRLERSADGWRLFVPRKTVDVLLDQIPCSISTVFHPWMLEPISVTW